MADKVRKMELLFMETGMAHHEATGGENVDWAIWYADYLYDRLPEVMETKVEKSELIYYLMLLSKNQPEEAPDKKWQRYYAEQFLEQYG